MVLTAEQKTDTYPAATMEPAQRATENLIYAGLDSTAVAKPFGYPTDTYTTPNNYVAKVQAATGAQMIGPSITLKVMAGDKFNIYTSSWYKPNGATPGTSGSPLSQLLNALTGGIAGASIATGGHSVTQTQLQSGNVLNSAAAQFLTNQANGISSEGKPNAYLNWVLFDEQFKLVSSSSGFEQVSDSNWQTHVKTNMPVSKNGYLYIYVSNATPNIPVYFDNLQVTHIHGPLLQEDHYYPHGLAMAGISDAAITTAAPNIYKANSSSSLAQREWADGSGLEMYETPARMYDAQIGRFGQTDPLAEQSANASEYAFVLNNPVSMVDPMGLQGQNPYAPGSTFFDNNNGDPWWWSSRPSQAFNIPKKAMDGGGGGVRAVAGGYTFTGDAAGQAFSALLYAITHPLDDGSWEFTVGQNKNGVIGYWQNYVFDPGIKGTGYKDGYKNLEGVGVGTRFVRAEGGGNSWESNKLQGGGIKIPLPGGDDADWEDNDGRNDGKGNRFRGGGQGDRDGDMHGYPPEFLEWYHDKGNSRYYKLPGQPDPNLDQPYQDWKGLQDNIVKPVADASFWTLVGIATWETLKWTAAVALAPETGGASLELASVVY